MRRDKLAQPLEIAEERQVDCFWHDNSSSLRYLLILPGVHVSCHSDIQAAVLSQSLGSIRTVTKEYCHVVSEEPGLLPGTRGPVSVMLVL